MNRSITFETPQDYNAYIGWKTLHPQVSVIDFSKVPLFKAHKRHGHGYYSVSVKYCGKDAEHLKQRRHYYGVLVCTAPNQAVSRLKDQQYIQDSWSLLFHPDIIRGTHLVKKIKEYAFFSHEALYLSEQERKMVIDCFRNIDYELRQTADRHSVTLICSHIELLLNYCLRIYDRQFISRHNENTDILSRFEKLLDDYLHSDLPKVQGLPSVKYCADRLNLSANYLGDLVKKETGMSPHKHIQLRIIETAKEMLFQPDRNVSQIAYELGFEYPQYFSRLFKKNTGVTPNEYRIYY